MSRVVEMRPRGYYLAHEVGRLAGLSGDRIGQWARRGYIRSSVSRIVRLVYSYQDVAEAMAVHELIVRGTPLQRIKRAIELLRESTETGPLPKRHSSPPSYEAGKGSRVLRSCWSAMEGSATLTGIRSRECSRSVSSDGLPLTSGAEAGQFDDFLSSTTSRSTLIA